MAEQIRIDEFFSNANHQLIIRDVFAMYHHQWDVIGESVQNAVDSVLKQAEEAPENYEPTIEMTYNARTREIVVKDNGTGVSSEEVKRVVAPHVSLKSPLEANRGEFGVGLTFVAFSSNNFKLESVCGAKKASIKINNGYNWAMDDNGKEKIEILFDLTDAPNERPYTEMSVKPIS